MRSTWLRKTLDARFSGLLVRAPLLRSPFLLHRPPLVLPAQDGQDLERVARDVGEPTNDVHDFVSVDPMPLPPLVQRAWHPGCCARCPEKPAADPRVSLTR